MPIEFAFLDYLQTLHTPLLDELMLFITTMAGRGELALVLGAAVLQAFAQGWPGDNCRYAYRLPAGQRYPEAVDCARASV